MRTLKLGSLSLIALAVTACQTVPPASQARPEIAQTQSAADPAAILNGSMNSAPRAVSHTAQRKVSPYAAAQEDLSTRGDYVAGGLYKPGVKDSIAGIEINADLIPEPDVVALPRSAYGNKPVYSVLGKNYFVLDDTHGYREEGTASYYGKKFHGRRTSAQEVYDMYAFSAAHKTLPIPSFARVTNLDNGKSVVVRINDRGPFHEGRLIDLSLAAATKIGIVARGTGRVSVEALQPDPNTQPVYADSGSANGAAGVSSTAAAMAMHFAPQSTPAQQAPAQPVTPAPVATTPAYTIATGQPKPAPGAMVQPAPGVPSQYMPEPMVATKPYATTATSTDNAAPTTLTTAPGSTTAVPVTTPQLAAIQKQQTATDGRPAFRPDAARFAMRPGESMSAERFDTWLKDQKITIATGAPRAVQSAPLEANASTVLHQAVATADVPVPAGEPLRPGGERTAVFAPITEPATQAAAVAHANAVGDAAPVSSTEPKAGPGQVILQVASFSSQTNAMDAMNKLIAAGIGGARLVDGVTGAGGRIWRLRIGPVATADSNKVIEQVNALGLGRPQRVM